ncbi:MAG: hypothetical protein HYX79_03715 [Chloroflexi bacterium]|nr:hypothetical protein [Chloroflexota bacterium]
MIVIECSADEALVKCVTSIPKKGIIHDLRGKGGVCEQLSMKWRNSKGLVDEDDPRAGQPPYIKSALSHKSDIGGDIKLLHDESRDNYLIVLSPRLEEWILKSAQMLGIDVTRHGLPSDADALHRVVDFRLDKLRTLLHMMIRRKSERLLTLKQLLEDT